MFINVGSARLFFDVVGECLAAETSNMVQRPTLILLHGGPGYDHSTLRPYFDRIACAYLIGTASDVFSQTLSDTPHIMSETLDKAVPQAVSDALEAGGGVVLFSPE